MASASPRHLPVDATGSSGRCSVGRDLAALERTLSTIASETAIAAESLRADDSESASWWLDRLLRAALATRDTCRAARAAVADGVASHSERGGARSADATAHAFPGVRACAGRWIVVGYDGSASAERALLRAAGEAGESDAVVVVTLVEPAADPSQLLAAAKATVTARCSVADVVVVAREGDPAEELLEVARAANADLVIVGRRGKDGVAQTLLEHAPCDVLVVA